MKSRLITSLVLLMVGIIAAPLHADLPQQRKAVDELQAAKKSNDPLPLLERDFRSSLL